MLCRINWAWVRVDPKLNRSQSSRDVPGGEWQKKQAWSRILRENRFEFVTQKMSLTLENLESPIFKTQRLRGTFARKLREGTTLHLQFESG